MRKFVSKIYTYPKSIREDIDGMIDKNVSNSQILKYLINYTDKIGGKIPDPFTLQRYVEYRLKGKIIPATAEAERKEEVRELQQYRASAQISEIIGNKKELLEVLITKCSERLNSISDRGLTDVKWEHLFKGYLVEIREIVSVLAKLSGELKDDQVIIVNIVQGEMTRFLTGVYQVLKEICPEKLDAIKAKLKEKFKEVMSQQ